MHLPQAIKYIAIVDDDSKFALLHQVADLVTQEYAIQIEFSRLEYTALVDLLKVENDRNFNIFLSTKDDKFRIRAIKEMLLLIENSSCNHKLCLIDNDDIKTLFPKLVGSLNLAYLFSNDRIIRTYGIQPEKEIIGLKSTLITEVPNLKNIEIANVRPIILDYSLCGVLEPSFYFVGVNFQTCIASVFHPDSMKWKTAYLIQCDDSGTSDVDMVKICFVNEEPVENADIPYQGIPKEAKWIKEAQALSRPESRFSTTASRNRSLRLEAEEKNGIVTLPVLEPYLEVKWPKEMPQNNFLHSNSEIEKNCMNMLSFETDLLENKRFGA